MGNKNGRFAFTCVTLWLLASASSALAEPLLNVGSSLDPGTPRVCIIYQFGDPEHTDDLVQGKIELNNTVTKRVALRKVYQKVQHAVQSHSSQPLNLQINVENCAAPGPTRTPAPTPTPCPSGQLKICYTCISPNNGAGTGVACYQNCYGGTWHRPSTQMLDCCNSSNDGDHLNDRKECCRKIRGTWNIVTNKCS